MSIREVNLTFKILITLKMYVICTLNYFIFSQ